MITLTDDTDPMGLGTWEKRWYYCGKDCINTHQVFVFLLGQADEDMRKTYEWEMDLALSFIPTNLRGCAIDEPRRLRMEEEFTTLLKELELHLAAATHAIIGQEEWSDLVLGDRLQKGTFKVGSVPYNRIMDRYATRPLSPNDGARTSVSPIILAALLYDHLGIRERKGRSTKRRSVDNEALASLAKDPKVERKGALPLVEYRIQQVALEKQLSYLKGPFRDGRFTYTLKPGRETFRISASKDPLPE